MATVLDDLAGRLVSYGSIGTTTAPSPTIFIGQAPVLPDTCVWVKSSGGGGGIYTMGGQTALVTEHGVQVIARSTTYSAAETLAWRVYAALDNYVGTLNGTVYLHIIARHTPREIGVDENMRTMFVTGFNVQRKGR